MVLVDVTWSEWRPGRDRSRYEQIVRTLVQPPARNSGELEPVYVHQCYEEDRVDTSWMAPAASYELPPADVCHRPGEWQEGSEGLIHVLKAVGEREETARETDKIPLYEVPDWGKLFRTRVFMSAERFRAVADGGGGLDYWVLIDMRFQWIAQGSVLWHTSFSAWSDLPWSLHHRPDQVAACDRRELAADEAAHFIADYERSRQAFREIIKAPDRSTLRVFSRYYQPPSFLVAVPDLGSDAGNGEVQQQKQPDILSEVANAILGTRHYELVPRAPLKSGVDVFRRFLPDRDCDMPRYLLIPDTRASARISDRKMQENLRGLQEEATANCITILTDLEAYAASQLGGIDSRMRTRENHLRIYQGVAGRPGRCGTRWPGCCPTPVATGWKWSTARSRRSTRPCSRASLKLISWSTASMGHSPISRRPPTRSPTASTANCLSPHCSKNQRCVSRSAAATLTGSAGTSVKPPAPRGA
jgi:hypothetical protein